MDENGNKDFKNGTCTMSPNTLQLELRAEANTPADVLVKDFLHRAYKEFKGLDWKQIIYQEKYRGVFS